MPLKRHRVGQVARRHELRLSHRARPRAAHERRRDVALLEDDQRREQFVTEIIALKVNVGEAGEGSNDAARAGKTAEVRLQPPDPKDHRVVNAVKILRSCKPEGFGARFVAAALNAVRRYGACDIVPNGTYELGLRARVRDDRGIEGDPGECAVERRAGNAPRFGQRPECFNKSAESSLLRSGDFAGGRGARRKRSA